MEADHGITVVTASDTFRALPDWTKELMVEQEDVMLHLIDVLDRRIAKPPPDTMRRHLHALFSRKEAEDVLQPRYSVMIENHRLHCTCCDCT